MSNPISSVFSGSPSLDKVALEKNKQNAVESEINKDISKNLKLDQNQDDQLILSEIAKKAISEPSFDRSKVEAIKNALKEGNYPMNARRIAESFAAIEKLID
tara:strand:+ start:47 stop:352 length:306 start_codon:yes stop_codon:yes gene_type:complete